jgi:hypothetical protein
MRTVHEFFTNARMDGAIFVHSWFYSWMVSCFAPVVARVESLRGRMSPSGMISEAERQVEGLFGSLLAESFDKQ